MTTYWIARRVKLNLGTTSLWQDGAPLRIPADDVASAALLYATEMDRRFTEAGVPVEMFGYVTVLEEIPNPSFLPAA